MPAWPGITAYLHLHYAKALEESHPEVADMLFKNMKLDTDTGLGHDLRPGHRRRRTRLAYAEGVGRGE